MTWYYRKFPRRPVSAEKFEMRGSNNILSHFHYRVDPELVRGFFSVPQLDEYWLPTISPPSQLRYARVKKFYYKKILGN